MSSCPTWAFGGLLNSKFKRLRARLIHRKLIVPSTLYNKLLEGGGRKSEQGQGSID